LWRSTRERIERIANTEEREGYRTTVSSPMSPAEARNLLAATDVDKLLDHAIDAMGWPEIRAFQDEMSKGQDVREDAGGFFLRCIRALFGGHRRTIVTTYKDAARALLEQARSEAGGEHHHTEQM
jgi:hypothetical protein